MESYKKKYKEGFLKNTNIQGTRYGKGLIPCILERKVGVGTIRADKRKYCFEEKWMVRNLRQQMADLKVIIGKQYNKAVI